MVFLPASLVRTLLLAAAVAALAQCDACSHRKLQFGPYWGLDLKGCTPLEVGKLSGKAFSRQIKARIATRTLPGANGTLQPIVAVLQDAYDHKPSFARLVNYTMARHKDAFPDAWSELLGLAAGTGIPLLQVFFLNSYTEWGNALQTEFVAQGAGCTDILLRTADGAGIVAHNEDNTADQPNLDHYWLRISGNGKQTILYISPPGELGGEGASSSGFGKTANFVAPNRTDIMSGYFRNFIGRRVWEARSYEEAVGLASLPHMTGHIYNFLSLKTGQATVVESGALTAVSSASARHDVQPGSSYFHANMFTVDVMHGTDQADQSSEERMAALRKYAAPKNATDMLWMLGDESHPQFPVFIGPRGEATKEGNLTTLYTLVLSSQAMTMHVYNGNPRLQGNLKLAVDLRRLWPAV